MLDGTGRNIEYLRISVTDKCNLRCAYCMPPEGVERIPHDEILTLEEIFRVVEIAATLGIKKVRLTGGEPMVRKNLVSLVEKISAVSGIEEVAMTTNGVLFANQVDELKKAGLGSVNISLDTLDAGCFKKITGVDALDKVLMAVDKALAAGMKVKINCVPCKELNAEDIMKVAALARDRQVDVRFIELMPIGCAAAFHGIGSEEIREQLEALYGKSTLCEEAKGKGPAVYYTFPGFTGKIGFISPITGCFCASCNRIRLTAEGRLKLCLHYNNGIDLRKLLRDGSSDEIIRHDIENAVKNKPKAHNFTGKEEQNNTEQADKRKMFQIGG